MGCSNFSSMKRFLYLVLLGALAGATILPILMFLSDGVVHVLFPQLFGPNVFMVFVPFKGFITGRDAFIAGFVMGACSMILWRGRRTFWPRFGSAIYSVAAIIFCIWKLTDHNRMYGSMDMMRSFILSETIFCLPLLLWSLALFFFAILTKRRPNAPLP